MSSASRSNEVDRSEDQYIYFDDIEVDRRTYQKPLLELSGKPTETAVVVSFVLVKLPSNNLIYILEVDEASTKSGGKTSGYLSEENYPNPEAAWSEIKRRGWSVVNTGQLPDMS